MKQYDLIVVGGGGSGLTTAVRAAEKGIRNIAVLEKKSSAGGNAFRAVGMLGAGTQVQQRQGHDVPGGAIFKMAMEASGWRINGPLVQRFINNTPKLVSWLEDKGLHFVVHEQMHGFPYPIYHEVPEKDPKYAVHDNSPSHGPGFVGSAVVEKLLEECKLHGIALLTKTKARGLRREKDGYVISATASDHHEEFFAKAVVLAGGGFGGNLPMLIDCFPEFFGIEPESILRNNVMTDDGSCIVMAGEVGAETGVNAALNLFGPMHHPGNTFSAGSLYRRPYAPKVNRKGVRFYDEATTSAMQYAMNTKDNTCIYAIADRNVVETFLNEISTNVALAKNTAENSTLVEDLAQEAKLGKITAVADTLEGLAEFIGCDPEVLKKTFETYNADCKKGQDGSFLKDPGYMIPLEKPPFYALAGYRCLDTTHGGITIDESFRVLGKDGHIVDGLYACGDICSGWVTNNYSLPGSSLGFAFNSGYLTGEAVYAYLTAFKGNSQ